MKIRVVVADDSCLVREGVVRALNADPEIEVIAQAENGNDALELAQKLDPDVMILDLRMPGLGGLAVLDKLNTSCPQIRPSTLLDAIAAGAASYVSKRSTAEELRQAVITVHGGGSVIIPPLASRLVKEHAVVRRVVQGMSDSEIATALSISPSTVRNHLKSIRERTDRRWWQAPPDEGDATSRVREPRRRPPDGGSAWAVLRPHAGP